MSVSAQIIFPYMSDARTPAMNVPLTAQDACNVRSFQVFLSAMLIVTDVYLVARSLLLCNDTAPPPRDTIARPTSGRRWCWAWDAASGVFGFIVFVLTADLPSDGRTLQNVDSHPDNLSCLSRRACGSLCDPWASVGSGSLIPWPSDGE